MTATPERWQQRFQNFSVAFTLLKEVIDRDLVSLNALECEGAIQRFKFAFDMACRVLNDYLEYSGIELNAATPRDIIKGAFSTKLIADGQAWSDMLDMRRHIANYYDIGLFRRTLDDVKVVYFPHLATMHATFSRRLPTT